MKLSYDFIEYDVSIGLLFTLDKTSLFLFADWLITYCCYQFAGRKVSEKNQFQPPTFVLETHEKWPYCSVVLVSNQNSNFRDEPLMIWVGGGLRQKREKNYRPPRREKKNYYLRGKKIDQQVGREKKIISRLAGKKNSTRIL